jgi:hypothetical protein
MPPIYLSADSPRWTPKTEADLQAGIDQGLLGESHYVDLKAMPDTKGDNKEAARDLVSFAVDGGTLIYGIAEDKNNRTFTLASQPLKVLADKIQNIATSSLVDPVLTLVAEEIPSDADSTTGFLVVHIPASPIAPHMADGRYYGRSDKSKYVLSDLEVLRLHERRRVADLNALTLLQHEIDNDPIPAEHRQQAHLFLLAQPLAGRKDMLVNLTAGPRWSFDLLNFVERAYTPELDALLGSGDIQPSLRDAGTSYRRSRGTAARVTSNIGEGRIFQPSDSPNSENAIELQVQEDGGLRLFFSRLSAPMHDRLTKTDRQVILDATAVTFTRRLLALVLASAETGGYFGNWAMAVGAISLRGLASHGNAAGFAGRARYDQVTYTETTTVSWAELNNTPGAITRRLLGPFLRSFEAEQGYAALLTDPTPPTT